jgi:hypothetical protein
MIYERALWTILLLDDSLKVGEAELLDVAEAAKAVLDLALLVRG